MENSFQWSALEGDPYIFNEYTYKLGMSQFYRFEELMSLDYSEMGLVIDTPVLAVIINTESKGITFSNENIKNYDVVPFFMRQNFNLGHACGLIAILHSLGNIEDFKPYETNSILDNFFEKCKNLNEHERTQLLEKMNEIKKQHSSSSGLGQTIQSAGPNSQNTENVRIVKNHFSCFILHKGNLVELDGQLEGPNLIKENVKEDEFLDSSIAELKRRLNSELITESLSIMFLTRG